MRPTLALALLVHLTTIITRQVERGRAAPSAASFFLQQAGPGHHQVRAGRGAPPVPRCGVWVCRDDGQAHVSLVDSHGPSVPASGLC